eukprot:GHVN01046405.1.p1 GENE.GHVN01046405.1~~GHVN01046405.1.p1  ORF type:complete len:219 (+),score=6.84 GHVN01046405.1:47-703(+)
METWRWGARRRRGNESMEGRTWKGRGGAFLCKDGQKGIVDTGSRFTLIPSHLTQPQHRTSHRTKVRTVDGSTLQLQQSRINGSSNQPLTIDSPLKTSILGRDALHLLNVLGPLKSLISPTTLPPSELKPEGRPIRCAQQFWHDQKLASEITQEIYRLERAGIIEKCPLDEWISRVASISKPHGGKRSIINLRDVNAQVKPLTYTGKPAHTFGRPIGAT